MQTLRQRHRVRAVEGSKGFWVLQEAGQEDSGDAKLALQRHLEPPDSSLRKQDDYEVRAAVHTSGYNIGRIPIETVSDGYENVPILLAWMAKKDFGERDSEVECKVDPDDEMYTPVHTVFEPSRSEDLHVLEKDRSLNNEYGDTVHDCADVAILDIHVRQFVLKFPE